SAQVARVAAPGVLLVGDAAGFYDPFTGEGLSYALRGAELAAEAVEAALGGSRAIPFSRQPFRRMAPTPGPSPKSWGRGALDGSPPWLPSPGIWGRGRGWGPDPRTEWDDLDEAAAAFRGYAARGRAELGPRVRVRHGMPAVLRRPRVGEGVIGRS